MVSIEKLFLNALHNLAVGYEMHLMHTATIGFFLMMFCMLIVEITILLATFYNHTNTPHVVMVHHHRRERCAELISRHSDEAVDRKSVV